MLKYFSHLISEHFTNTIKYLNLTVIVQSQTRESQLLLVEYWPEARLNENYILPNIIRKLRKKLNTGNN